MGRMWFFVVLCGNDYAVSNDFSATREIFEIFRVLLTLKERICRLASADLATSRQVD